jgi:antitoxin YefM
MENITVEELKKELESVFIRVSDDQEPISVTVDQDRKVVVVDADEYKSIMETFFLLRSPANAERLREGLRQHRQGQVKTIDVEAYLD